MKIKIAVKSIIKYIYALMIFFNIFLLYQIYNFAESNVLEAISPKESFMSLQNRRYSEELNIKKFGRTIENIKEKKNSSTTLPSDNNIKQKISTSSRESL